MFYRILVIRFYKNRNIFIDATPPFVVRIFTDAKSEDPIPNFLDRGNCYFFQIDDI